MRLIRRLSGCSLTLATATLVAGCGQKHPVAGAIQDRVGAPAEIVLTSEGGIATMRVIVRLDSATGALTRTTCRMPTSAEECGTLGHLEQKTLTTPQVESIFRITQTQEFQALKRDYGSSTKGADLMGHAVIVTTNDRTRTIKGDDITLPETVERLRNALYIPLQENADR